MTQLYAFLLLMAMLQAFSVNSVWAQSKTPQQIDMNQFDQLKPKPKPAESGVNIETTCTTPQGTLIKKGERGFDTCLANAQSPVMNQPRETEKENDPRKQ